EDETDRKGRRQTTNAAMFYGIATMLVCAAAFGGLLRPWGDIWALAIPVTGVALLVTVGRHFLWRAKRLQADWRDDGSQDGGASKRAIAPRPARIRLAPMKGYYPVRNADNDDGVIYDDYVPRPLGDRIYGWIHAFRSADDWDDPAFWAEFAS